MASFPQSEIIYLIILGSGGMLSLIGGIAIFIAVYQKRMILEQQRQKLQDEEYQQKMIQLQLESQETERRRIAQDLHDSVGSLLWGAKLAASYIDRVDSLTVEQKSSHRELMKILDQSIQTVKRIAWELTPEAFHYSGLSQSLTSLCGRFDGKGLQVQFLEEGEKLIWNDHRALFVFRIVQELVSNTIKHALASCLTVHLFWTPTNLIVKVSDDGQGFTLSDKREGVGWWNIQHRSSQLNAKIEIGEPPIGLGSAVTLTVPLQHAG